MRAGAVLRVISVLGKSIMPALGFLAEARDARCRRSHRYTFARGFFAGARDARGRRTWGYWAAWGVDQDAVSVSRWGQRSARALYLGHVEHDENRQWSVHKHGCLRGDATSVAWRSTHASTRRPAPYNGEKKKPHGGRKTPRGKTKPYPKG